MPRRPTETLLLILALFAFGATAAAEIRPFDHQYRIYRGENTVARARMKLQPQQGYWVWALNSEPVGWLKLLTRKRPFTETWLRETPQGLRIMLTRSGDHDDRPAERSTWFDDERQKLYYAKGDSTKQLDYDEPLHDVLSIHLLYPELRKKPDHRLDIAFYKKGKIRRSQLSLEPGITLRSGDRNLTLDRVTQTLEGSDKRMIYYYMPGEIAPVKIEQYKGKTEKSVMWRQDVK
jgi:hypothetical protein